MFGSLGCCKGVVLEFKDVKKEMKRDTVLEENLLDVKRLLKNSAFAAQAK